MAILDVESFGGYGAGSLTTADTGSKWSVSGSPQVTDLGDGRARLTPDHSVATSCNRSLPGGTVTTVVIGFRLFNTGVAGGDEIFASLMNGGDEQLRLVLTSDNRLRIVRLTTTLATSVDTIPVGTDKYCEVRITFSNTVGEIEMWIEGVSQFTKLTGQDTSRTGTPGYNLFSYGNGTGGTVSLALADMYWDSADVHGSCFVIWESVNAGSAEEDWTASAGNPEDCVDEIPHNSDTDYVESSTTGDRQRFGCAASAVSLDTILAIVPIAVAKKLDANPATLKVGVYHGSSESQSAGLTIGTSYVAVQDVFELNPTTSLPWTEAEKDATEISIENG